MDDAHIYIPSYITPELLNKYLGHQCTQEEKDQIDAWYDSYDRMPEDIGEKVGTYEALKEENFMKIVAKISKDVFRATP